MLPEKLGAGFDGDGGGFGSHGHFEAVEIHLLEGIGHFPWLEQPGSVLKLLRAFAESNAQG
jgi:pimeloyl-ACP methyl ester carboxylesterase